MESLRSEHKALIRKNEMLVDDIKKTCAAHVADLREYGTRIENHDLMLKELKQTITDTVSKIEQVRADNREHYEHVDQTITEQLRTVIRKLESMSLQGSKR